MRWDQFEFSFVQKLSLRLWDFGENFGIVNNSSLPKKKYDRLRIKNAGPPTIIWDFGISPILDLGSKIRDPPQKYATLEFLQI